MVGFHFIECFCLYYINNFHSGPVCVYREVSWTSAKLSHLYKVTPLKCGGAKNRIPIFLIPLPHVVMCVCAHKGMLVFCSVAEQQLDIFLLIFLSLKFPHTFRIDHSFYLK